MKEGKPTACAEVCPAEATIFGKKEDLIWEARTRIRSKPGAYLDHIYGLTEAGGTSVIMISNVPFEKLRYEDESAGGPAGHAHLAGALQHPRFRRGLGRLPLWSALDHRASRGRGEGRKP